VRPMFFTKIYQLFSLKAVDTHGKEIMELCISKMKKFFCKLSFIYNFQLPAKFCILNLCKFGGFLEILQLTTSLNHRLA
jgi:hypothetical protein